MMDVAHYGSFDRENFGDLLYPVVITQLLQNRIPGLAPHVYSFLPGTAPGDAGYAIRAIAKLFRSGVQSYSATIVGGGDLLRTDAGMLASHYESIYEKHPARPIFYRLRQRLGKQSFRAEEFQRRHMPSIGPGPFLVDPSRCPAMGRILYCSCGVPFEYAPIETAQVKAAMNSSALIYLRDFPSKKKLLNAGVTTPIEVAPDVVTVISDLFPADLQRKRGMAILNKLGITGSRPVVVLQCVTQNGPSEEMLVKQLAQIARKDKWDLVLLPLGYCHDDHVVLARMAYLSGAKVPVVQSRSIYDMLAVIAASSAFVGTSMHGNITAFSYGIPHLVGPIAVEKIPGFLEVVGLERETQLNSWEDLPDALEKVMEQAPQRIAQLLPAAKTKVQQVMNQVISSLLESSKRH